jgi:hypothetical protein
MPTQQDGLPRDATAGHNNCASGAILLFIFMTLLKLLRVDP